MMGSFPCYIFVLQYVYVQGGQKLLTIHFLVNDKHGCGCSKIPLQERGRRRRRRRQQQQHQQVFNHTAKVLEWKAEASASSQLGFGLGLLEKAICKKEIYHIAYSDTKEQWDLKWRWNHMRTQRRTRNLWQELDHKKKQTLHSSHYLKPFNTEMLTSTENRDIPIMSRWRLLRVWRSLKLKIALSECKRSFFVRCAARGFLVVEVGGQDLELGVNVYEIRFMKESNCIKL